MSLLMKALKQAEQSKRSADKEDFAPAPEDTATTPDAMPDLELEMAPAAEAKSLEPAEFKPHFSGLQAEPATSLTFELSRNHSDQSHSEGAGTPATGKGPGASSEPKRPSFAPPAGVSLPGANDPHRGKHGQAKNLFVAKLPARPKHKPLFWAIAAAAVVMVAALQGYRLWQEYTRPANFSSDITVSSTMPQTGHIEKPGMEAAITSRPIESPRCRAS